MPKPTVQKIEINHSYYKVMIETGYTAEEIISILIKVPNDIPLDRIYHMDTSKVDLTFQNSDPHTAERVTIL